MFDIFAGPLMDEAGDTGAGGGAPADTGGGGGESTALTTTATDTSLATIDDTGADDTGGEPTDLATTEQPALENGRPSKATSVALQSITKTHPQLARQIPRDMAIAGRLRSMFPGVNAFDSIRAMERRLKQLGGEEGIQKIQGALADIEELDRLYAQGDPRMLDKMTDTPEGKAAFAKIAPHAIALFEKIAPKAFTKYMAGIINGDLMGQRVDMTIQRIAELTPKELAGTDGVKYPNPVVAELAKLQSYFTRLAEMEKIVPEVTDTPASTANTEIDRERQELARQRTELKARDWKSGADSAKNRIFTEAWTKETKGRKIAPVDREDIQARIATRLPLALKQEPGFSEALKDFFESDDRAGYLRYLQSLHEKHIPRIVRAEIQRRYGAPNGKTSQPADAATTSTTTRTAVEAGFKRVGTMPHMNTVDSRRTSAAMWKDGRAVLKSGERVQWK